VSQPAIWFRLTKSRLTTNCLHAGNSVRPGTSTVRAGLEPHPHSIGAVIGMDLPVRP